MVNDVLMHVTITGQHAESAEATCTCTSMDRWTSGASACVQPAAQTPESRYVYMYMCLRYKVTLATHEPVNLSKDFDELLHEWINKQKICGFFRI